MFGVPGTTTMVAGALAADRERKAQQAAAARASQAAAPTSAAATGNAESRTPFQPSKFRLDEKSAEYDHLHPLGRGSGGVVIRATNDKGKPRAFKFELNEGEALANNERRALQTLRLGRGVQVTSIADDGCSRDNEAIKQKCLPGVNYYDFLEHQFNPSDSPTAAASAASSPSATTSAPDEQRLTQVLDILFRLAVEQVVFFHGFGFQHFDLKPQNLMVNISDDGQVHGAHHVDFGFAEFKEDAKAQIERHGSPQFACLRDLFRFGDELPRKANGHADVYGLALTMLMHLSGLSTEQLYAKRGDAYQKGAGQRVLCESGSALLMWLMLTEKKIPELTAIPDEASAGAKAIADLLHVIISAGEEKGMSPRDFLQRLLAIYGDEQYRFPDIAYAARARKIVGMDDCPESDEAIKEAFNRDNDAVEEVSRYIKTEVSKMLDLSSHDAQAFNAILDVIAQTHPMDRTVALAHDLWQQCAGALKSTLTTMYQGVSPNTPGDFFKGKTKSEQISQKEEVLRECLLLIDSLQAPESRAELNTLLEGLKVGLSKPKKWASVERGEQPELKTNAVKMARVMRTHRAWFPLFRIGKTNTQKALEAALDAKLDDDAKAEYQAAPAA
jgi:serine/threonine protein kinase